MNKKTIKTPLSFTSDKYSKSKAVSRFKLFFGGEKLKSESREKCTEPAEINQVMAGILDLTHIMAVYLDPQFNFLWVNQSYAESCKQEPSFFPGKNHFDLYPHEENQEIFKRVVDTGEPFYVEAKPFEFPDQPERGITYWDWSLIPAKDPDGKVVGLVFTLVEVTDKVRVEIALKKSEAQYRELVQNANSAIIRWKIDGTLVFFNEYAQEFFGYREDDIIGRNVSILLPDKDSTGIDLTGLVNKITSSPDKYENNVNENVRSDGARVWIAWTNKPIFDDKGNVKEILAVGTDITALKNAEMALVNAENEKSLILDNADELIAYYDNENNLIWANRVYLKQAGLPLSKLQGKKCFHCWGLEKVCIDCPVIKASETGQPQSGELTPENQAHWPSALGSWDIRSAPVKDNEGNTIGVIEIAREITEQKKTEKALRALAHFPGENPNPVMRCTMDGDILYANAPARNWLESLEWKSGELPPASILNLIHEAWEKANPIETEITSLTGQTFNVIAIQPTGEEYINLYCTDVSDRKRAQTALQEANDSLEEKVRKRTSELEWRNRELQEFAYVASHDLQEPLRKIKLFGELIENELKEMLTDRGKDYLQRMNKAADRMQKLIKDLLSYSRVSSKTGPFELVDLKTIVDDIARDLLPEEGSFTPVIETGDMPKIDADPVQMHQLFQNLLSNAIHYHREGQAPVVKISSRILKIDDKRKRMFCELIINDNGIGFDMVYVDKIFMPFERLNPQDKYQGTGMGLAICRKITERHGGKIAASSVPGEGATFIVTLPLRQTNDAD
ncbi:MAG: PAS domain-containing protein [Desulfatiglans sp.]|jgi:PAS domain S-box-containing protein|nr:PAS domain-containing protein [Desulfatiglans sp.]